MLLACFILLANLCLCMPFSCQSTEYHRVIGNNAFLLLCLCHFFFFCCLLFDDLMIARCLALRSLYKARAFCTISSSSSISSACCRYFCAVRRSLACMYTIE